jgi:hypothetical protein
MVHGESQLWVFAVVGSFHFLYGQQAHARAIVNLRMQAAKVFRMTQVVAIGIAFDERMFGARKFHDDIAHAIPPISALTDMTLSSCWGLEPGRKLELPLGLLSC